MQAKGMGTSLEELAEFVQDNEQELSKKIDVAIPIVNKVIFEFNEACKNADLHPSLCYSLLHAVTQKTYHEALKMQVDKLSYPCSIPDAARVIDALILTVIELGKGEDRTIQ